MTKFIIRRVIQALPVIWLITVVSFLLMQQAPGGPQAAFNQNPHITPGAGHRLAPALVPRAQRGHPADDPGVPGLARCLQLHRWRLPVGPRPAQLPACVPRRRDERRAPRRLRLLDLIGPAGPRPDRPAPAGDGHPDGHRVDPVGDHRDPGRRARRGQALQPDRPGDHGPQLRLLLAADLLARPDPDLHLRGRAAAVPGPGDHQRPDVAGAVRRRTPTGTRSSPIPGRSSSTSASTSSCPSRP